MRRATVSSLQSLCWEKNVGWYLTEGAAPPFTDDTEIVKGATDGSKRVRFEVDGLTTATTRVLAAPDADIKLSGHATGFTANRIPYATGSTGGVLTDSANLTYDGTALKVATSVVPYVLAQSAVAVNAPADTAENTLATLTIPAGAMGPNGRVRITSTWSCTNNANAKTARTKFGGTSFQEFALASTTGGQSTVVVANRNSASSQVGSVLGITDAATVTQQSNGLTTAVNSANAVTVLLTAQKATAGDTLTLESYMVELFYGA